ncbi:ribonuclease D [Rhodobacteraceae bacterium NNCM2]|nr:ribonuclease D [Coraliihabitans acroporae]
MNVITTTSELAAVCQSFAASPYVTVDTEFIRERTYWSQLCLVQMARPGDTEEDAVLIDPLAEGIDLGPLFELMKDSSVVKVFHAARQDVEIFHHLAEVIPTPLVDTQVMAMVCGHGDQVGYETIVRRITRAEIDKSSRFTDWARRPLSEKQLKYALADVTHLRDVYEALQKHVDASGRAHWVAEEMDILTSADTYVNDPDTIWTRVKARSSNPKFLAIIRSLARWREITAQSRDIPRSRVLKDDALLEIATAKPKNPADFGKLRLAQRDVRKPEVTAEILAAIAEGVACPPDRLPQIAVPPRRKEGSAAVSDMLRVFLKARADELKVASKLIASSSDLDALAGEANPDLPLLKGWRREVFGNDALRICSGEIGLAVGPTGIKVIELQSA